MTNAPWPPTLPATVAATVAEAWQLAPAVVHLNHGSFGACPLPVQAERNRWQRQVERDSTAFYRYEFDRVIDAARRAVASLAHADAGGVVFVPNATAGVNTVLRSLPWSAGDEILLTDHSYGACIKAARFVADRSGAQVRLAQLPFAVDDPLQIVAAIERAVTARTKLAIIDHVTSPTAMVLPIKEIADALAARDVDLLVDGAHGPGMLPLDLDALGAAYYTGNFHKWLCAPKSVALLHVRADHRQRIVPLPTSHGYGAQFGTDPDGRSGFLLQHDWPGTIDASAIATLPFVIDWLGGLLPGGIPALQAHNRGLALAARAALCDALGARALCPASMIGSMATVALPGVAPALGDALHAQDPLLLQLDQHDGIRVALSRAPGKPEQRLLRISAQIYNTPDDYHRLIAALSSAL